MKISRRDFIKIGTFATAFAGTALFAPAAAAAQEKIFAGDLSLAGSLEDALSSKTVEDFRTYTDAEFMFLMPERTIPAILVEVTDAPKNFKLNGRADQSVRIKSHSQNFLLSFQMPSDDFLQANYQLRHSDFGQFDLFLVPDRRDGKKFLLHAVINRL